MGGQQSLIGSRPWAKFGGTTYYPTPRGPAGAGGGEDLRANPQAVGLRPKVKKPAE